ncbi:MAG: hypothetical protein PVF97_09885 [Desulfobacterales bacterium]|jgi:hypothetical protein
MLSRWVVLLCACSRLIFAATPGAAEGYTLVLEDGRRIDITAYEEKGDWVYYYRYDARIGVPRKKVKSIMAHPPREDAVPLDDEILGRIAREHHRRFQLDDFRREEYVRAEMAPLMSPEEQRAYVRKLLQLKAMEIFEIDDQRQAAERQGDVAEIAQKEEKLVSALAEWVRGREALARMARRPHAADRQTDDHPSPPEDRAAPATAGGAGASAETDASLTGLEQLRDRQATLRLLVKKHARVNPYTGGFHARQQAEKELRIVGLQIQYFDRLSAALPPESTSGRPGAAAPAPSTD